MGNLETSLRKTNAEAEAKNTICPTCNKRIIGEAYEVSGSTKYHLGWCYRQRNQD